jgi:hypothetical protein
MIIILLGPTGTRLHQLALGIFGSQSFGVENNWESSNISETVGKILDDGGKATFGDATDEMGDAFF